MCLYSRSLLGEVQMAHAHTHTSVRTHVPASVRPSLAACVQRFPPSSFTVEVHEPVVAGGVLRAQW